MKISQYNMPYGKLSPQANQEVQSRWDHSR